MNKLDIKLGGHNLTGDDLLFLQKQLSDTLLGFAKTTGEPILVIYGCVVSVVGPNKTWTAGLMYINGELCEVMAGSAVSAANDTWIIDQTYDPAGNQVYEDLTTEDTYILRRAIISGTAGGTNLYTNARNLRDYLITPIGPWISMNLIPSVSGNWGFINGGGAVAGYRKTQINKVALNGEAEINNYSTVNDTIIAVLPAFHAPQKDLTFVCAAIKNTVRTFIQVQVNTSGEIKPIGLASLDDCTIFLESIEVTLDWSGIY